MQARKAEAGIVKLHAQTLFPATPQRTAETLRVEPTPTIAPVMVCVVETGMPKALARNSVIAPPTSAQKPCTGFNFAMRSPIVFTLRHPPIMVPHPLATHHNTPTHASPASLSP